MNGPIGNHGKAKLSFQNMTFLQMSTGNLLYNSNSISNLRPEFKFPAIIDIGFFSNIGA